MNDTKRYVAAVRRRSPFLSPVHPSRPHHQPEERRHQHQRVLRPKDRDLFVIVVFCWQRFVGGERHKQRGGGGGSLSWMVVN